MLVGMTSKINKTAHTSVWIAQESREPRLNVYTNQILVHTFSHGILDSAKSCSGMTMYMRGYAIISQ